MTNNLKAERTLTAFDAWFNEKEGYSLRSERFDGDVEWLKAAFEAGALSTQQPMGGGRVKPLEWNENGIAKTIIGIYWIGRAGGDWRVFFQININRESIIATGSASGFEQALIEARAAAEIDWQERGRAALNELALHPNQESGE